jgi:hypothetical protein
VLHGFFEAHSLLFLFKESADEVFCKAAVFVPGWALERRLASDDVLDGAGVILRLERGGASEHFEHGDAESPKINPFVVASADVDLWSLVEMRTNYSKHVPPAPPLKGLLADAKIDYLHSSGLPAVKNILGFDIPMANITVMQVLDSLHELLGHRLDLLLGADVDVCEAGPVEALHHQVGTVLLEIEVESFIADDGRMSKLL